MTKCGCLPQCIINSTNNGMINSIFSVYWHCFKQENLHWQISVQLLQHLVSHADQLIQNCSGIQPRPLWRIKAQVKHFLHRSKGPSILLSKKVVVPRKTWVLKRLLVRWISLKETSSANLISDSLDLSFHIQRFGMNAWAQHITHAMFVAVFHLCLSGRG